MSSLIALCHSISVIAVLSSGKMQRMISAVLSTADTVEDKRQQALTCRHATWYGLSVSNTDFGLF